MERERESYRARERERERERDGGERDCTDALTGVGAVASIVGVAVAGCW